MNSTSYIKIALFVVVLGTAGAGYVVLSVNGIGSFNTHSYYAVLDDASGLSSRSKIYLAGVPVGKVQAIELTGNEARITLVLLKDVEVRKNAVLSRRPSSLLGTSVLTLDPGTRETSIIPSGSMINTIPLSGDLNKAMGIVQDVGEQAKLLLEEFRTNQMALLAVSLETFNSIAKKIDARSDEQLANLSHILESVALITERTERMLRTGEDGSNRTILDLRETLENIRLITSEIASGRGNLGRTVYDDELYTSILATVKKTEEAVNNITGLAKNADEIVGKALGLGIQFDAGGRYDFIAETARANASIRLNPASNDRWYRVGVTSMPEGVTSRTVWESSGTSGYYRQDTTETKYTVAFDAELARQFSYLTIRGGLLESTAGFGIDLHPVKWLNVSGELFNFDSDKYPNLRGSVTIYPFFNPDSNKPWNWVYIRGGINNALSGGRDYFLGGGLRFADREIKGLVGLVPLFN